MEEKSKGHSHLEKSQDGNYFRRAFVGVPQSKAVALSINSVLSLDAATALLASSSRGVAMSIVCRQRPVWKSCPCCLQCCCYHMKTCATGNTSFFLKQLIVFMPELNEKDHRTVLITGRKPGLKELIQDIFTNVEVSAHST